MDNITFDLLKTLHECDPVEALFLARKINRELAKNKYYVYFNRDGTLTSVGEIAARLYELLYVHGVMKYVPNSSNSEGEELCQRK